MKKIIFTFISTLLFWLSIWTLNADFISNSISIKRLDNISYWDDITVSWSGDIFNIRMNIIPNSSEPNNDFKIILSWLPNNLTASWYTINSDTCNTNITDISQQNNTFTYRFTPNGWSVCNAIITANYITNNTSNWDYKLSYTIQNLSNNTLRTSDNSANLEVNNFIRIIKAQSIDSDIDGYIDGYNITLNQDIWLNIIDTSNLVISDNDNTATGLSFTKLTETTAIIRFDDNIFHTWNTPNINITSAHNNYDADIYTLWVLEDTAAPYLSTINWNVYNGSNITISTIPSTLEFNFLEPIREDTISGINIQLSGWNITWTHALNSDKNTVIFTPSSAFSQWNYSVIFNNQVIDIAGNTMTLANASMTLWTPSSGWGWGGGWWGGWGWSIWWDTNYELEKYLTKIHTKISKLKSWLNKLVGTLNLDEDNILTSTWETIELKVNNSWVSTVKIYENTNLINYTNGQDNTFYPAIQIDEDDIISDDFIIINGQEIIPWEVAWLYKFNPELGNNISLSNPVQLELLLKRISTFYPVHVYYLNDLNNGWERLNEIDYIMNSKTNTIKVATNKFGYYIIIQNRYLEENAPKISELNNTENIQENISNTGLSFSNLEEKLNETLQISAIEKLAHKFYLKFVPNMSYFDYFVSFDTDIAKQYNSYAQAHYNMFVALEKYVLTKDNSEKIKVIQNLKIIAQAFSAEKDLKTKYITVVNKYFVPNNSLIKTATTWLRAKVEKKLNNLLSTNSITQDEYNTAVYAYNDFILHLTIFFEYNKLENARIEALKQARIFIPIYNKKIAIQNIYSQISEEVLPVTPVVEKPVTPVTDTTPEIINQRIYGDVYYFDYELRLGNYNDDVQHLQKILKKEWYFNYTTTSYYWEITAKAVADFAKQKLGLDVTWNVFNREIINWLLAQPMK